MAMTKKEQAEMDRLRREAAMAKALAWPTFEKPEAMIRDGRNTIHGWFYNAHTMAVTEGWASDHLYTEDPASGRASHLCGSQTHRRLYFTADAAYRAMIHELARQYAETLAGLYAKAGIEL